MHVQAEFRDRFRYFAAAMRMVFFAGLPGTGKSFFVHQLAHLAHAAGRAVHLLQWDVARPVLEASTAGRRYPILQGVTHPVIRRAAGIWVRGALVRWHERYADPKHLLIGETPLVGHRFIELARREEDAAEPLLVAPSSLFIVPVPSVDVRRSLEAGRDRRVSGGVRGREREDAPPNVLRELWGELVGAARSLGLKADEEPAAPGLYDPVLYEGVYRHVLGHRRVQSVVVERLSPGAPVSVYAFSFPTHDVIPTETESDQLIRLVEARYRDLDWLKQEMDRWYIV